MLITRRRHVVIAVLGFGLLALIWLGYLSTARALVHNPFPFDMFLVAVFMTLLPLRAEEWSTIEWFRYGAPLACSFGLFVFASYISTRFIQAPSHALLRFLGIIESAFFFATFAWILIAPGEAWPSAKLKTAFRTICIVVAGFLSFAVVHFIQGVKESNSLEQIQPRLKSFLNVALLLVLLASAKRFVPAILSTFYLPQATGRALEDCKNV